VRHAQEAKEAAAAAAKALGEEDKQKAERLLAKQKSWQLFSEKWMKRKPKTVPCLRSAEAALCLLCSWLHNTAQMCCVIMSTTWHAAQMQQEHISS